MSDPSSRFLARRTAAWVATAAPAADPAGQILDLAGDDLDQRAAPHIVQATIDALRRGETHYTDRVGIAPLRKAIADELLARDGLHYQPKGEVLICGGGHEALFVATQIVVRPGEEALIQSPAPAGVAEAVRLAGGIPLPVTQHAADRWTVQAAAVAAQLTPRTRVLVLASPAVPTGGVTTGSDLAALAALAVQHDLKVVFDESYRAFCFAGAVPQSLATLPGMRERTALVGSFSARYAMSGWRAGYVAATEALLKPIASLKQALTICSPAPGQWAALAAIEGPQEAAEALVTEIATRRQAALATLSTLGLPAAAGQGTPFLFVDVRRSGLNGRDFAARALHEVGVRLLPGEDFGPDGTGYVRLTLAAPAALLTDRLAQLGQLVPGNRGVGGSV